MDGLRKVDALASPYVLACLADGKTASWMIANAPTEQCLVEAAIFAQARTGVTHELRMKWANQISFRMQMLKPSKWEKVPVAEALGDEAQDGRPKVQLSNVIASLQGKREMDCAEHGEFQFEAAPGLSPSDFRGPAVQDIHRYFNNRPE